MGIRTVNVTVDEISDKILDDFDGQVIKGNFSELCRTIVRHLEDQEFKISYLEINEALNIIFKRGQLIVKGFYAGSNGYVDPGTIFAFKRSKFLDPHI